ncbi:kinase-like protein [Lentithecium fluviatile CBS 122367]|uniref:non-specific serine/threonine protein kinase n=1 Tax=Lentithecium fluviatile CBS 122367 TaxID=1168545 RepID=A0A6G1JE94_9PLEO|nr:kinase-like protein [Lentithecium fluviatile CBS 122367]
MLSIHRKQPQPTTPFPSQFTTFTMVTHGIYMYPPSSPPSRFTYIQDLQRNCLLGRNNAGIYLIHDTLTGKSLIEKHLKPRDVREGFAEREIDILYQLRDHPNITNLVQYDLHASDKFHSSTATLWTEFCDGGSLEDMIMYMRESEEGVTEEFLWHVLESLVEAVRYCQRGNAVGTAGEWDGKWNPIYHRDIQPGNIFMSFNDIHISEFPRVLLGDFGCSTSLLDIALGNSDPKNVDRQDTRFAPPEAPGFGLRSDIYQIGLVMWCLMCCQLDPGDDFVTVREDVLGADMYSQALREIVAACLEEDVKDRPRVEELVAWMENERELERCMSDDSAYLGVEEVGLSKTFGQDWGLCADQYSD